MVGDPIRAIPRVADAHDLRSPLPRRGRGILDFWHFCHRGVGLHTPLAPRISRPGLSTLYCPVHEDGPAPHRPAEHTGGARAHRTRAVLCPHGVVRQQCHRHHQQRPGRRRTRPHRQRVLLRLARSTPLPRQRRQPLRVDRLHHRERQVRRQHPRPDQEEISRRFASKLPDKFEGITYQPGPETDAPILDGVLAWIECQRLPGRAGSAITPSSSARSWTERPTRAAPHLLPRPVSPARLSGQRSTLLEGEQ